MAATMAKARALQKLLGDQARAAAPDAHVWLSASAGTGKTHVLTARVFRLLLQGAPRKYPLPHLHQGGRGGNGRSHP